MVEVRRFARVAVRLLLSLLVIAGILAVVYLAFALRAMVARGPARVSGNVQQGGSGDRSPAEDCAIPWPRFPGCQATEPSEMTINGVRTVSEEWEICAGGAEVLSFLKEQMGARGWVDCTEAIYGLDPESVGRTATGLQDKDYIETYEQTIDSCLAMRDRTRFMQATLEPGTARGWIRASLFMAETPSYDIFSRDLAMSLGSVSEPGDSAGGASFVEESHGSTYDTRVLNSVMDTDALVDEFVKNLSSDSWRVVLVAPGDVDGRSARCALFQKDRNYAYLTVTAGEGGGGSSAVLTTVEERGGANNSWQEKNR